MLQLGLKLFASNTHLAVEARQLLDEGVFSYIELYAPPGTYASSIDTWRHCGADFVIHAPHWGHGVNLSDAALRTKNAHIIKESQLFADTLHADSIIVHGGFGLDFNECARQLLALCDPRLAIENVPCEGLGKQQTTVNTPEQVAALLRCKAVRQAVLDIGHALYAANALSIPWGTFMQSFLALQPRLFHISDGDKQATVDVHKSIGSGDFDLKAMLRFLPPHSKITLETPRLNTQSLAEAKEDAQKLRALCKERESS